MTLDEAIAISEEIGKGDTKRAANNRWLAQKLRILKWVDECHIIDEARRAREEMHQWQNAYFGLMHDHGRLKAENAKMRKLFYEAWDWMQRARYDGSIRANEMDEIGTKAVELGFPDYELGIEVDE